MRRKIVSFLLGMALFTIIGTVIAQAPNPPTGLTITNPIQVQGPDKNGIYGINATGTMSLATGDTLDSTTFTFTGPNDIHPSVTMKPPFNPPKAGSSSNYSCNTVTGVKGGWSFTATMVWTPNDIKETDSMTKTRYFNVPQLPLP